jgi:hypothetical protein
VASRSFQLRCGHILILAFQRTLSHPASWPTCFGQCPECPPNMFRIALSITLSTCPINCTLAHRHTAYLHNHAHASQTFLAALYASSVRKSTLVLNIGSVFRPQCRWTSLYCHPCRLRTERETANLCRESKWQSPANLMFRSLR